MNATELQDDDTVYMVAGRFTGSRTPIHLDPDCQALGRASDIRELPYEEVASRKICKYCAGDHQRWTGDDEIHDCEYCGETYRTSSGLSRHVLQDHSEEVPISGEKIVTDGGIPLRGPQKCPECGHDPSGDDDEFVSGGGWIFDNSVSDGVFSEIFRCPVCRAVVSRNEKRMGLE